MKNLRRPISQMENVLDSSSQAPRNDIAGLILIGALRVSCFADLVVKVQDVCGDEASDSHLPVLAFLFQTLELWLLDSYKKIALGCTAPGLLKKFYC